MNIGILVLNIGESVCDVQNSFDINYIVLKLNMHGYYVTSALIECKTENVLPSFELVKANNDVLLILGNREIFCQALESKYVFNLENSFFELDGAQCYAPKNYSEQYLIDVFIPALDEKNKTIYTTKFFKTFGQTEEQLRKLLANPIKNRNKISFRFISSILECDVLVRYSNKTSVSAVNQVVAEVTTALSDCLYSLEDKSLSQTVAELLMLRDKKIKIAESFTGGGVASSLVQYAGISNCLKEGIVCYSNSSKISRLKVDPKIIANYGAVSIETAYEMAANLLMDGDCDIAVATTGNAGPTSEKPDQQGLCFIAVGDIKGVNLYNYYFVGDRQYVTTCGIKSALFRLYQMLTQDEFKAMLLQAKIF